MFCPWLCSHCGWLLVFYNGTFPIAFSLFVKETPVSWHFIAEPHRKKKKWQPTLPGTYGSHVTVRPPARSSAPQANQCEMLHFLASLGAFNLILHIHVVVSWQLSKQSTRWPISPDRIAGSGVDLSRLRLVFYRWQVSSFQLIAGSTLIGFLYWKSFFINGSFAKPMYYENEFSFTRRLIKLLFAWMIVHQALLW